jgi:hypothetical protein
MSDTLPVESLSSSKLASGPKGESVASCRTSEKSLGLIMVQFSPIAIALALLLFTVYCHWDFGSDELENLQFAWLIAHQYVPFRDFFEHHPPFFHYLLSGFVGKVTTPDLGVLCALRLVGAGFTIAVLAGMYKLARLRCSTFLASAAVLVYVIVARFPLKLVDLRADWLALAALLWAAFLLTRVMSTGYGRGAAPRPHEIWNAENKFLWIGLAAGILCGTAISLTQKAAFIAFAFLLWTVGTVLASSGSERAMRLKLAGAFLTATVLTSIMALIPALKTNSVSAYIQDVVIINMSWPRALDWHYVWRLAGTTSFGLFLFGFVFAVRTSIVWRRQLRLATLESLIALVQLVGIVAYVRTPVPYMQSFVFLVSAWTALAVVFAVKRYARIDNQMSYDLRFLIPVAAVCLTALGGVSKIILVWMLLLMVAYWVLCRAKQRLKREMLLSLLVLIVPVTAAIKADLWNLRSISQAGDELEFFRRVSGLVGPEQSVINTWPVIFPFRPLATYYPFIDLEMTKLNGPQIETACLSAADSGKVRAASMHRLLARQYPRLTDYLRTNGVPVEQTTKRYGALVFVLGR